MKDGPSPEEEEALIEAMIERDHHVHGLADEWEVAVEEVDDEVEEFVEHLHHLSDGSPVRRKIDAVDEPVSSYQQAEFNSEEMNALLRNIEEPDFHNSKRTDQKYRPAKVFPDWLLKSKEWKTTKAKKEASDDVSEILRNNPANRTAEQQSQLVYWIMSVWPTADKMGMKKCNQMLQEFKYISYEPEENIIREGEAGMTFYIIIAGETAVHKAGIGVVAKLGKGKSFGELALTKGDVRTATIKTITRCEVLSLHKLDYDHFVKDIQQAERREHFHLIRECPLFSKWTRSKIDKICNTCTRKTFEAGATIFRQGDSPDLMYVVMEGVVEIVKEVVIVCKNRWPTAITDWEHSSKRTVKPIRVSVLRRGGYFGELAIVRNSLRAATAICHTKCVLVCVDKLEFLHLINQSKTSELEPLLRGAKAYPSDVEILNVIGHISGGPQSKAQLGEVIIMPNKIERLKEVDARAATRLGETKSSESAAAGGKGKPDKNKNSHANSQSAAAYEKSIKEELEKSERRALSLAKFQGVAKETSSEQTELAEARRAEELVAQSIAQSAKHGPIDPHPLSTVAKALSRDLSHKSIPLVKPRVRRNPGSDGHDATSLGGGNSLGELGSGLGSFAASLDPLDHVTFAPKAMIDRPRGASWTVRMPEDLIVPLVGTVTNVKRVPTGTVLRRLGSPEQAMKHSSSARTFTRKVPLEDPRPSSRNTRELSTRELVGKAVLTYRDAISERASPPRSRG